MCDSVIATNAPKKRTSLFFILSTLLTRIDSYAKKSIFHESINIQTGERLVLRNDAWLVMVFSRTEQILNHRMVQKIQICMNVINLCWFVALQILSEALKWMCNACWEQDVGMLWRNTAFVEGNEGHTTIAEWGWGRVGA